MQVNKRSAEQDKAEKRAKTVEHQDKDDANSNIDADLLSHSTRDYLREEGEEEEEEEEQQQQGHQDTTKEEQQQQQEQQQDNHSEYSENNNNNNNSAADNTTPQQRAAQHILHNTGSKPIAGSEEWHRMRKDNHKEVERRRRENINFGIKELAGLLPTPETNKSQILQRAIEYIKRLKENDNNNIEKWTLEKLLNDQALAELTASNEKLKLELERAYREVEHWKKVCSIAEKDK